MAKKNAEGYLSAKESRRISRENRRITDEFEKKRKRKHVPESEYTTKMRDPANAVEFDDLHTYFFTDTGTVKSVDGVSFDVPAGKTVGIVGESGCGKSVTSLSLMQLVQRPQGQIVSGEIRLNMDGAANGADSKDESETRGEPRHAKSPEGDGADSKDESMTSKAYEISKVPQEVMQKIRGNYVSMIFQEPMTSLNPVFRIGKQVDEVIALHDGEGKSKADVKSRTIELLEMVGIANSEGVYRKFPHELSGGMRQRVMIAMALACNPRVIIADEPTTALDVTIQAQILDLLRRLKDRINSSIMLITHDLGVIAEMADYVVVMYAGRVVEKGTAEEIFEHPSHPYTIGLMASKPVVGKKVDELYSIPGKVPNPVNMPNYCYFKDRCEMCVEGCGGAYPHEVSLSPTHKVSCYRYYEKKIASHNASESGDSVANLSGENPQARFPSDRLYYEQESAANVLDSKDESRTRNGEPRHVESPDGDGAACVSDSKSESETRNGEPRHAVSPDGDGAACVLDSKDESRTSKGGEA